MSYITRDTGFFITGGKMIHVFPKDSEILEYFHNNRPKGVFKKVKYVASLEVKLEKIVQP